MIKIFDFGFYLAVGLTAVLLHFHLQCLRESEERNKTRFNHEFDPSQTEFVTELKFIKKGVQCLKSTIGEFLHQRNVMPLAFIFISKLTLCEYSYCKKSSKLN